MPEFYVYRNDAGGRVQAIVAGPFTSAAIADGCAQRTANGDMNTFLQSVRHDPTAQVALTAWRREFARWSQGLTAGSVSCPNGTRP